MRLMESGPQDFSQHRRQLSGRRGSAPVVTSAAFTASSKEQLPSRRPLSRLLQEAPPPRCRFGAEMRHLMQMPGSTSYHGSLRLLPKAASSLRSPRGWAAVSQSL